MQDETYFNGKFLSLEFLTDENKWSLLPTIKPDVFVYDIEIETNKGEVYTQKGDVILLQGLFKRKELIFSSE